MKTSVYLSNQSITAVVGEDKGRKLKVKACYRGAMPPGLIFNGAIIDAEQLTSYLGGFFNMYKLDPKNVSVVIDNDNLINKILEVPILKRKELLDLVRNEFNASGTAAESVYDYAVLSPRNAAGKGRILAISMETALIKAYTELFAGIGVRLSGIDSTLVAAILMCQRIKELKGHTYIMSMLEGAEMFSMLFADGEYAFSQRVMLAEQRGTPAAAVEISRALSSMVQFNYTGQTTNPLSNAFLSGLLGDEVQFCPDMADALAINVGLPPATRDIDSAFMQTNKLNYGEYLFCLGDLLES